MERSLAHAAVTALAALFYLSSISALGAEPLADGFYLQGAKRELKIQKSELLSDDNANSRFQLQLTIPYDPSLNPDTYLLVIAGREYRQGGSGASGKQTSSLTFQILEDDNAKQVARYFDIPIAYHRHPGHKLRVTFTPTQQSFGSGTEVTAVLRITNVGAEPIAFRKGGRNRGSRDNQYIFAAHRYGQPVPEIGTNMHMGGLSSKYVLQPAATFEDTISLSKWFAFDTSGYYDIHGSYFLDFVEPQAQSWRTIWTDYVGADFVVKID